MDAITITNLTKQYKEKLAVDHLNLNIAQGELVALLGVNGAGKTTTIRMLSCLLPPTSGDARLLGESIVIESQQVKQNIAVSPQETAIAPNLTVRENLALMAGMYGATQKQAEEKAKEMIDIFSLAEVQQMKGKKLSGGWQRRLSIAMAFISSPKILFLDEPTLGLDILARRELQSFIQSLKGKITIVLTTHYLEEAEALSDRVCIMQNGKVAAMGTVNELKEKAGVGNFEDAFLKLATAGEVRG